MTVLDSSEDWGRRIYELEEVEKNFLFFLEHTSDYIYFKDAEHRFTYTSNSFARITGHNSWKELVGKTDFDIFPHEHAELYFAKERAVITDGQELVSLEEPYYDPNGKLCWASSSKRPILDDKGNIVGLFGISRDITPIKKLEEQLIQQAHYDGLTKLLNRAFFQQQSEKYIELARRNHNKLAFFFIDLDDFKNINDNFGHEAGDEVLRTVGERLSKCFREADLVGRLGGDEFVVLAMTECDLSSIQSMVEKLFRQIQEPILYRNRILKTNCSIGVSCFPDDGTRFSELIRTADHALYRVKQSGKGNCCSLHSGGLICPQNTEC